MRGALQERPRLGTSVAQIALSAAPHRRRVILKVGDRGCEKDQPRELRASLRKPSPGLGGGVCRLLSASSSPACSRLRQSIRCRALASAGNHLGPLAGLFYLSAQRLEIERRFADFW